MDIESFQRIFLLNFQFFEKCFFVLILKKCRTKILLFRSFFGSCMKRDRLILLTRYFVKNVKRRAEVESSLWSKEKKNDCDFLSSLCLINSFYSEFILSLNSCKNSFNKNLHILNRLIKFYFKFCELNQFRFFPLTKSKVPSKLEGLRREK